MQQIMTSLIQASDFWPTWASSSLLLVPCYLFHVAYSLIVPRYLFLETFSFLLIHRSSSISSKWFIRSENRDPLEERNENSSLSFTEFVDKHTYKTTSSWLTYILFLNNPNSLKDPKTTKGRRAMRKHVFGHIRTLKTQIGLRIRVVWSEFSLSANKISGYHYENTPFQIYRKFHLQKTENFQIKKLWYVSYFCSKHRLWVLVRTASTRRF